MKKYLLLLLAVCTFAFVSCKKDKKDSFDAAKQAELDDAAIRAYIAANNADDPKTKINATKDANGIYYQVITPGTGNYPTINSVVNINYTGTLLNGTEFDKNNINMALSNFIDGWKLGIPYINKGGRLLLLIPSGLAYGNRAQGKIPANSPLIFVVDLISFR